MRMMVKNIETRGVDDVLYLLNKELDIYLRSYNYNHADIRLVMSKETYYDLLGKITITYEDLRYKKILHTEVEFNNDKPFGRVTIWPCHCLVSANGYFDTDIAFNYGDINYGSYFKKIKTEEFKMPEIKNVIFNAPATIVFWTDGTKTVVKCSKKDNYDPQLGIVMAMLKKISGNKSNYKSVFKPWVKKFNKEFDDCFSSCMNPPINSED